MEVPVPPAECHERGPLLCRLTQSDFRPPHPCLAQTSRPGRGHAIHMPGLTQPCPPSGLAQLCPPPGNRGKGDAVLVPSFQVTKSSPRWSPPHVSLSLRLYLVCSHFH